MLAPSISGNLQQTTNYKVVLPFYIYATLAFFVACTLLYFHTEIVNLHHFNPVTLAITHTMALGWGTMIILGASHQLLPVLIEGKLQSNALAIASFVTTGLGIPLVIGSFYVMHFDWILNLGAILVNVGVLCYLINVWFSSFKSSKRNVHAWYMLIASLWLFLTTVFGFLLAINFTVSILPSNSLEYLSIHAHLGIVGWFLLLVIGVGSRLIPMFLISKYTNDKTLWWILILINLALVIFIACAVISMNALLHFIPVGLILIALLLFANHIRKAYHVRIRKQVDNQMKLSIIAVLQTILPVFILICALITLQKNPFNIPILYGFMLFFGWLTALIMGMTFKTLPFIVWNKTYHAKAHAGKTPAPKDLFSERFYQIMFISYIFGFILFSIGVIISTEIILRIGAIFILNAAIFYTLNTFKTLYHKPN